MDLNSLVFKVKCGNHTGTAFLISESLALTAFHVVKEHQNCEIHLFDNNKNQISAKLSEKIDKSYKVLDIAMLEFETHLPINSPILIVDFEKINAGTKWSSKGFPAAKEGFGDNILQDNRNVVNQQLSTLKKGKIDIELEHSKKLITYEGYSGAPLIINGAIAGIINTQLEENGESKELSALSLKHFKPLLEAEGIKIQTKKFSEYNPFIEQLNDEWFQSIVENSIKNLGKRYTPELNIELDISKCFDAISRNDEFRQNVKDHFHKLLKPINKCVENFSTLSFQNEVNQINTAIKNIETYFYFSQKLELIQIDIDSINKNVKLIRETLSQCDIYNENDKRKNEDQDSHNYSRHLIRKSQEALYKFSGFLKSPILFLANHPIMLLLGDAGIGKSHLLADICSSRIGAKTPCILILGQHFTSKESPWTQILNNLLRIRENEKEFLKSLNSIAETHGERILLCIDAINEGQGCYFWPDNISGFINECSKYPWIGIVLSVRSSYEKLLVPKNLVPQDSAIRVTHHGFRNAEFRASSFFFSQYGIEQPGIPILHPEFSNPLFLKLFCEGLHRAGHRRIPKGYSGITIIIDFFLESVDKKLSSVSLFDYPPNQHIVKKVINELIEYKLERGYNFIPYEEAFEIADRFLSKFSSKRRFLDALISEGVLSKNLFWLENSKYEEGIYLAYERFEDHLTAAYLLDKYLCKKNPEKAFKQVVKKSFFPVFISKIYNWFRQTFIKGRLSHYIDDQYYNQGILEALSIQIPEQTGKELYELLSDENKAQMPVIEAFINSLIWRKIETINEDSKEYINTHVLKYDHTFDLFFQMVYSVSSDPEHLYNANSLHRFLIEYSLPDLDAIWTTYLHDKDYEGHSIQRLISWTLSNEDKSYLSNKSRLLASKALAWLFSSTNIPLRDSATKALTILLVNQIDTITQLLSDFDKINDPYVFERIFATAYGAVLHSEKLDGLEKFSLYIIDRIFKQEEVYPNVLVRDYARNIIEYALYKGIIRLEDPSIIRPPYKSFFQAVFPTNEDIDAYKYDYKSESFKDYYWGQNSILSSMVTEYGRGVSMYGNFGRYTFQSAMSNWDDQLAPNDLSNYACKLIFEKYGYDVEKHGQFDRHANRGDRYTNIKERIGKKYQWIALYEILARVSDNYKMIDESTFWGEDKKYIWFQGPWEPFVRNIDPTFISFHDENNSFHNQKKLWNKINYNEWNGSHEEWLIDDINLPNPEEIIAMPDGNNEWLALEKHPKWEESVPVGKDKYEYPHKYIWYQIRSYLVGNEDVETLIDWAKNQHFMGRWFPERNEQYQVFCREYYWSPAYRFFDNPYYGREHWEEVYDQNNRDLLIGKVLPTTEGHFWETGSGDKPSYLAPREYIYSSMNLQYSNNIGEWLNNKGDTVCFDPSINQETPSCLIIKKNELISFLENNNLKIFWTVLGRKEIHGNTFNRLHFSKWLEISGVFQLIDNKVKGNLKPFIQNIKR